MTTKLKASSTSLTREATPRFATPRRPDRPTFGPQIARVAEKLGQPFMPWQHELAAVAGEYDPDKGVPYYPLVFYTVPRRNGKTLWMFSWTLRRMLGGKRRRVAWSAQSRSDARELWLDELYPMLEDSKLAPVIDHLGRANGGELIRLKNKSVMRLVAPGATSGHGKGLHASAEDEIFADTDTWRDQVFGPALLTVADSQTVKTSTAGTMASTHYNALRRAGREAVSEGRDEGMCYLEFSADDDWNYEDPNTYWDHMPALGYTITPAKIKAEIDKMLIDPKEGPEGVRRAFGNLTAGAGKGAVIPKAVWARVCDGGVVPDNVGARFAVAVAQDRSSSSIAVADKSGRCELLDSAGGTGWVVQRANDLLAKHKGTRVVLDGGGPAGALADSIDRCDTMGPADVYRACGAFFDAVVEARGIAVKSDPVLDASLEGAVKKMLGDRWVWSRSASTEDVTPIEALTLAWAGARGDAAVDPLSQVW